MLLGVIPMFCFVLLRIFLKESAKRNKIGKSGQKQAPTL